MAEVLLFHHALGVTAGVQSFADQLRAGGHTVTVPDLFDGVVFDSIDAGVAHAQHLGFGSIIDRGVACADGMGDALVVAGFSLGVLPAQKLAQTRSGVTGAILYHAAIPASEFGAWPEGVELQMHFSEHDPWAEEDIEAARALAADAGGDLYIYPGSGHLVTDSSFTDYDAAVAAVILERTMSFLSD